MTYGNLKFVSILEPFILRRPVSQDVVLMRIPAMENWDRPLISLNVCSRGAAYNMSAVSQHIGSSRWER